VDDFEGGLAMRLMALAVAATVLAGCSAGPNGAAEGTTTAAVIKAYREGDRPALTQALDQYVRMPDGADLADPCSLDSFKQRRLEMVRKTLAKLDNPTVISMSEEARFVHFENGIMYAGDANLAEVKSQEAACENPPTEKSIAVHGGSELVSTAKALLSSRDQWRNELQTAGDLDQRMKQARQTLERNNVRL
jgi:hypothetical protein